jgi:hypothetical protein
VLPTYQSPKEPRAINHLSTFILLLFPIIRRKGTFRRRFYIPTHTTKPHDGKPYRTDQLTSDPIPPGAQYLFLIARM